MSATLLDTSGITGGFATQGQREKEASDGGYLERNLKTEGCPPNENMQNLQCTHLSISFFRGKKKKDEPVSSFRGKQDYARISGAFPSQGLVRASWVMGPCVPKRDGQEFRAAP